MRLIPTFRIVAFLMLIGLGALGAQDLQKLDRLQRIERPQKIDKTRPASQPLVWTVGRVVGFASPNKSQGVRADDGIYVKGPMPETDTYTVKVDTDLTEVHGLRIEALT